MQLDAVGEELAKGHPMEDETDRAVALLIIPVAIESPPPPRKVPPPPPVSTQFKVRLLASLSVGPGNTVEEASFFQIADTKNNLTSFYMYVASGAGLGVHFVSGTTKGDWNDFTTNSPIRVSQFAGRAGFNTAGTLDWTINYFYLMGLPKGVHTNPNPLKIKTGRTYGLGASITVGLLVLKPNEEMVYNGD
jgi:hypothetical protein